MTEPSSANVAIEETINRARRLFHGGVGSTLEILKEADQRLSDKLHAIAAKNGGPKATFTAAHAQVVRAQIKVTTEYLEKRLAGHTHEQAVVAIGVGVQDTVKLSKKLEKHFTGLTRPLALDSQQMQDEVVRGTGASLLRRHQASFQRYGVAMVGSFERVLRGAAIEGLDFHSTVSRLVEAGKLGGISARSLHAKEPHYFPAPTSYVKQRYWAERIVRTEKAYAYNAASLQTMNVSRATDFPDMQKKILATFDKRTAPDSIAVHGQVRKLEEMFVDGAGRHYLHPPARPNDRETVVPWRPHWAELPATEPAPPEAQAEAKVAATPGAHPKGQQRKLELKSALEKAKASVLAKKAAQAQAQALELAKAKAKVEQAQASADLSAALKKQAEATASKLQAQAAAKKAAELRKQQEELKRQREAAAKAKVEAELAAKAAKLRSEGHEFVQAFAEQKYESHKEMLKALAPVKKDEPELFAEMWKQVMGKPLGKTPAPLAVAQLGKKLQPGLDWPKPKTKEQKAAEKVDKAHAKLLKTKDVAKELDALTGQELSDLIKAKLPIIKGGAETWAKIYKSTPALHADLQGLLKAQDAAEKWAALLELKEEAVGAQTYVNVFDAKGTKVAYFFKEEHGYAVKPPAELNDPTAKMLMQEAFLTDPKQAAAYAVQVSKAIQMKGAAAKLPVTAPKVAQAYTPSPLKDVAKPKPPPGQMLWSQAYKAPARPAAEIHTKPAEDLRKGLKPNRSGHALALDKDKIENFDVSFTTEVVNGARETVVRFKVTEHASDEVLKKLREIPGAANTMNPYRRLKDWKQQELVMGAEGQGPPGVWTAGAKLGDTRVMMNRAHYAGDEHVAAAHNVVEIRFPEPSDHGKAYNETAKVLKRLGIDAERPSDAELKTYRRAKIMAYVDSDARKDLLKQPGTVDAAVNAAWDRAVKRNPKLAEIEADAVLREVSPGHVALYSPTVAKMYEEAGVRWLEHRLSGNVDVLEQMFIVDPTAGLLASRERYQRGMFTEGMSTSRDFETGGADGVFLRLRTTVGAQSHYGTIVEVDPSELGRLDAYFFNEDNYGAAGKRAGRRTVDQTQELVRSGRLSDSNELMLQRQTSASSIRRVRTVHAKEMVRKAKAAGMTEINGIPVEDFFVE